MSLRTAIEKAQLIWNAQQKHPAHIETVFNTIGYTKATGPSLRAISALNQYGLTKETGSSDKRLIAVSDLAISYLLSNDPQERNRLLREAALKPTIFQHLWEHFGAFLPPSDDAIKSHLIREKNFNAAAVGELVANYRDTFDFAKLSGNGTNVEKPTIQREQGLPPKSTPPQPSVPPRGQPQPPRMSEGVQYFTAPLQAGDAYIPLGMSKEDWKLLVETLKVWKSRIVAQGEQTSEADKVLDEIAQA